MSMYNHNFSAHILIRKLWKFNQKPSQFWLEFLLKSPQILPKPSQNRHQIHPEPSPNPSLESSWEGVAKCPRNSFILVSIWGPWASIWAPSGLHFGLHFGVWRLPGSPLDRSGSPWAPRWSQEGLRERHLGSPGLHLDPLGRPFWSHFLWKNC